jgi:hypothetical protein
MKLLPIYEFIVASAFLINTALAALAAYVSIIGTKSELRAFFQQLTIILFTLGVVFLVIGLVNKKKVESIPINLKRYLSFWLVAQSSVFLTYVLPWVVPLGYFDFAQRLGYFAFAQSLILFLLPWLRPNITYYRDLIFGTVILISALTIILYGFRMDTAAQFNLLILLLITSFSIFETVRLRR